MSPALTWYAAATGGLVAGTAHPVVAKCRSARYGFAEAVRAAPTRCPSGSFEGPPDEPMPHLKYGVPARTWISVYTRWHWVSTLSSKGAAEWVFRCSAGPFRELRGSCLWCVAKALRALGGALGA
eukprot:6515780-Alexandrium_andersonii.AAC.1